MAKLVGNGWVSWYRLLITGSRQPSWFESRHFLKIITGDIAKEWPTHSRPRKHTVLSGFVLIENGEGPILVSTRICQIVKLKEYLSYRHNLCLCTTSLDALYIIFAQSRQSAKLFLKSSELGLPQPLTRRRVCPPPL
jgi:hypothetical protein